MLNNVRRRVRIWAPALLVGVVGSAPALIGTASSTAAVAPCGPVAARTLAADKVARVYTVGNSVYGCALGGKHPFKLGQRRTCIMASQVTTVAVAGRLAAYGLASCGVDTGSTLVIVRRLDDGVQLHTFVATSPAGPESYQSVDSLVCKADGAVAWIGTGSSLVGSRKLIEVRKGDRQGAALLDSGPAIDASSLRLHRSQLSWTHGGQTRTATLQ